MEAVSERRSLHSVLASISADFPDSVDLSGIKKLVCDAFLTFDHENNNSVDVRELGTIIRSLGCVPSEAEMQEIIADVEEADASGYVYLDRFLPVMIKILQEQKYTMASYESLVNAFKVMDKDKKGYLTKEELIEYLSEEGEPFSPEEIEEMLIAALDKEKNIIDYTEFATWLVLDDDDDAMGTIHQFLKKLSELKVAPSQTTVTQ